MNSYMDYLSSYNDFLMKEMTMQGHMMDCIEEAVCIAEGTTYVHEGVITNGLKNAWNKFVQFINKIFAKFKETFNRIDPKGYLEKYAGIITKQPVKFESLSMPKYDLGLIAQAHAEEFNPADIGKYVEGSAAYLKQVSGGIFSKYSANSDEAADIRDYITAIFCGGSADEVDFNPTDLNMTDLYNFCHDFKDKTTKELEKDQDAVIKSSNTFDNLLKEFDAAEKKIQQQQTQDQQQPPTTPAEVKAQDKTAGGNSTGSSAILKPGDPGYNAAAANIHASADMSLNIPFAKILEAVNVNMTKVNSDNGGAPSTPSNEKFSKNVGGLQGTAANKDNIATVRGFTADQIKAASTAYNRVNSTLCSVKLSLCQQIYSDYMKIIKLHVRSYVGEQSNTERTPQKGTNYETNNPVAQQKAAAATAAIDQQQQGQQK